MTPRFFEEMSWRMGEVYAAVTDQILINLARHFKYFTENNLPPGGAWQYQIQKLAEMGQVTQETEQIILNMLGDADGALRGVLDAAIRDGLKDAEKPLRKAAEKGLTMYVPPEVAPNQMNAFRAYYRQSADKLNMVNTVMLDSTQKAYQATVSDIVTRMSATQDILNVATGEVVSGVSSMNAAVRQGVKKMVSNGITGFIDHGGHHWSPEAYVTMDIRTTMANTARAAVFERQEDYGSDLYQVSWHDGARPLCYPWQGKVISRSDWSGEVEDGDGNKVHVYAQSETSYGEAAGLFGINCGHFPNPFFPGMSYIRPPEQNKEENDKEYELSQQQRALERNLRNEKRELEVMKAQGAPEDEIKAQRQRVKNARTEIDDFCDETGRARRTSREGVPTDAKWPVDGGEVRRFQGEYIPADESQIVKQATAQIQQPPVVEVSTNIEQFRSAATGAENKVEFWMNFTEEQQAAFNASGLKIDELFEMVKTDSPVGEWKAPSPGGAETFGIKHDFSKHGIAFEEVVARSEGWMADANEFGTIRVRTGGLGDDWDFVISHEAGHQLANASPELQQIIIENPGNILGRYNTRLMAFDGIYGEYNPEEAFATAVSVFVRQPEAMQQRYPETYKAIDTLFKTSPSARQYVDNVRSAYRKRFVK